MFRQLVIRKICQGNYEEPVARPHSDHGWRKQPITGDGHTIGKPVHVADIVDHTLPELKSHWSGNQLVAWITNFPDQKMNILVSGGERKYPLAITKRFGKGECLYFSLSLIPFQERASRVL